MSDNPPEVEVILLQKEMADLRQEVHDLSKEVAGLVKMWETASGVVAFVKWLAGLATAIGVLWAAFKMKIGG
jgi:hypothetical protein